MLGYSFYSEKLLHKLFVFLCVIGLIQSCKLESNIPPHETVVCDAETLSKNGGNLLGNKNQAYKFQNADCRNDSLALSGRYSLKLDKNKPFGFTFLIKNAHPDDYYEITVWRKADVKTGVIVASDKKSQNFYQKGSNVIKKDTNGWEQLQLELFIPPQYGITDYKVYIYNPSEHVAYFDDFKITRYIKKTYAKFQTQPLRIFIDSLEKQQLNEKRIEAFGKGILETTDKDWVDAIVFEGNDMMKAGIRLKGDWLDHLKGRKWSFRIKIKKENSWHSLKTFSIQSPVTRDFLREWIAHKVYKHEDLLTTRYEFVPVILNEESLGIYAYEEHFDKQLIESSNRKEGPIIKLTEEAFWELQKTHKETGKYLHQPFYEASKIYPFKSNRLLKNPTLYHNFIDGQNLLYQYKNMLQPASNIFDLESLAKYFALMDLTKAYHGLAWHNQRFYYNPILSKLEIIAFDGYSEHGVVDWVQRPIFGNFPIEEVKEKEKFLFYHLFEDSVFVNRYINYLEKYSDEKFVADIQSDLKDDILQYERFLQKEFPYYQYDSLFLYENARAIRDSLPSYKQRIIKNPDYAVKNYREDMKEDNYDTIVTATMPYHYVNAYLENKNSERSKIKIYNFLARKIIILGTGNSPRRITHFFHPEPDIESYNKSDKPITVNADTLAQYLFFMVEDDFETHTIPIMQWKAPRSKNPRQDLFADSEIPLGVFYTIPEEKKIIFAEGKHKVKELIVIPQGYKVIFEAGAKLNFINDAGLISYSPVFINGTKSNPVKIMSSDESAMGFNVLQAKEKSVIKYAEFEQLNALDYKGWKLTGGVTFYESDVDIYHTQFKNNYCEDALNIVRSNFMIDNSSFFNIASDAFDADFCTGKITNSKFYNINNDALDFSGSNVGVEYCNIFGAGDKGISGGESSNIGVRGCTISNSKIGMASKDFTILMSYSSKVSDCQYGLIVLRKKPEYGPASIMTFNFEYESTDTLYLIEKGSILNMNGKTIKGDYVNLASRFYDK